jgi:hypothetical protein
MKLRRSTIVVIMVSACAVAVFVALWLFRTSLWVTNRDKDEIREFLVRMYIQGWKDQSRPIFVRFEHDTDPSDAFLARLAGLKFDFRKGSRAESRENRDSPNSTSQNVFDRVTGEPGIIVSVDSIELCPDGTVRVRSGVHRGFLGGYGDELLLRRLNGAWTVVNSPTYSYWVA